MDSPLQANSRLVIDEEKIVKIMHIFQNNCKSEEIALANNDNSNKTNPCQEFRISQNKQQQSTYRNSLFIQTHFSPTYEHWFCQPSQKDKYTTAEQSAGQTFPNTNYSLQRALRSLPDSSIYCVFSAKFILGLCGLQLVGCITLKIR